MGVDLFGRRTDAGARGERPSGAPAPQTGFIPALTLSVTLAVAAFLVASSVLLLLIHPAGSGIVARLVIEQNQSVKTALYVLTLIVIGPLALLVGPRLTDAVAGGPNRAALPGVVGLLAAALVAMLIAVRLSASAPWGDGLAVVLIGAVLWTALAAAVLWRACGRRPAPRLVALAPAPSRAAIFLAGLLIAAALTFTSLGSISVPALAAGVVLAALGVAAARSRRRPRLGRGPAAASDVVLIALLVLAIPNVVVFHPSPGVPNSFFVPGIIQFHQDFLLGSANQLLGGGALMVNVPVSQYGVGYIYFLYAWFHLAPIGYGTYGLLDGIVTALFYGAGFLVLRAARTPRPLAAGTMALAVVALVYHLYYAVGSLPQQGPLRFGLPMMVILTAVAAVRWPSRELPARVAGLVTVGVAAIWSLEMLAYTLVTLAALLAAQTWLRPAGERRRWLAWQVVMAIGAGVLAQLMLAGATLAATGRLPDWGQYLAYVDALVLGNQKAGQISYGFADWSPVLLVAAASLASAGAVWLLVRRSAAVARREPVALVALSGTTAYAIALLSYSDNRSSTYLLPYVALPTLLAGALWLSVLWRSNPGPGRWIREATLAFALAVAALILGAAWPGAGANFDNTALAHVATRGGLPAAIQRLWHPPPIDPRAPGGEALLNRDAPARRALILLPDAPDLGTEILIRSRRSNRLSIGDPKADAFVDSRIWTGTLSAQLARVHAGDRLLTDRAGLILASVLRTRPPAYPLAHPAGTDKTQTEWILQRLAWRFALRPVASDSAGLIVATLQPR